MSKTYKKVPGFVDRNPFMKNYANRRLRKVKLTKTFVDGSAYKKHTCSWDISDWSFIFFSDLALRDHIKEWYPLRGNSRKEMTYEKYVKRELARFKSK